MEALGGDRNDQDGIRINDRWRICFRCAFAEDPTGKDPLMIPGDAVDVEIVDSPLRPAMTITAIDNLPPVHPGEILRDELEALSMSARKFAYHMQLGGELINGIPYRRPS